MHAKVATNAVVVLLLKANNATWTQESASVNQPLQEDVVIGVNWVTMVTRLMVAKVGFFNIL